MTSALPTADSQASLSLAQSSQVLHVLEGYLAELERGVLPHPEELLARHPDLAEPLKAYLASLDFLHRAAASLHGPPRPDSPTADDLDAAGRLGDLGDFRILREVGRGGMGIVYEAEQLSLGRRVALKVLPFAATMDPRHLQRFKNEAHAAAQLHHTNIVPVHYVGCERGVHFYAMQYIEGHSLAEVITELRGQTGDAATKPQPSPCPHVEATVDANAGQAIPPDSGCSAVRQTKPIAALSTIRSTKDGAYFRTVAELGIQAAEALDCAHQQGIVHRDVKPANLMVDATGRLWVTDFGLAQVQSDTRLTMTGDLVGTLRYMSPEQALAKRVVVDHRTDVYSLGATLYELLTLEPAFDGTDRQELLRQIAFEEPRPLRRRNKAIPAELETIVLKAIEKNPADRYATAQELAEDLERYLRDEPVQARRPSLTRRARKWARRHRPAVTAAVVCLLVSLATLVGSVGWVLGDRTARQQEAEGKVQEALEAAEPRLRKGNPWDIALISALRRAEAQLGGRLVSQDLRQRVEQLQKDVQMLAELEKIRLDQAWGRDGHYDEEGSGTQYARAFRAYGIDVEILAPAEAATLVQGSAIREQLVVGLDDWAYVLTLPANADQRPKADLLLAVARQVDPDEWRNRLRDAMLSRDAPALEQLAPSAPVEELTAITLGLLRRQTNVGDLLGGSLKEPLRRAQQRFPTDFWINQHLARALQEAQPPRLEEAVGFYRVAVALRPTSPGAHNNLGLGLMEKGDVEAAIAEYRRALDLDSTGAVVHSNLGNALVHKKDMDGAIAEYKSAIDFDPKYASPHAGLGDVLRDQGDIDGAIAEYRKAIRLKAEFADAHNKLGCALTYKGLLDEAVAEFREAIRLKPGYAEAHNNLGVALPDKGLLDEAVAEFREAIRLKPGYAEPHYNLGNALHKKGLLDEAVAEYREAIRLKADFAEAHSNLGGALKDKGLLDEAIAEFRQAIRLKGDYAEAHNNLGNALKDKGLLDEALVECREAIRLKANFAEAHNNLAVILAIKGNLGEAVTEVREAIRLEPGVAGVHNNLANILATQGRLDEAIGYYREAIRLKPGYAEAHSNLGNVLGNKGLLDEAIAEYREAIRLKKDDVDSHYNLAIQLAAKGQLDDAIGEYREAIRYKPDFPEPRCNLGDVLIQQGRFAEGLVETRRGHELGSKRSGWRYPSAQWVRKAELLVELDAKLPKVLTGEIHPANLGERLALAEMCQLYKRLYFAASRFYREAFSEQPQLASDLQHQLRYNAACAAALAGCGQGKDADQTDNKERDRLRQQALEWLRADLAAWRQLFEKEPDKVRPDVVQTMLHWLEDKDFAVVRGEAVNKLPEAERRDWQQLWEDAEALRKSAAEPAKKAGP
jgi:tetratricopeptide (TPR) repeat protein